MQPRPDLHCETCGSRKFGIFCQLQTGAVQELDHHKVPNRYRRKQVLFYEGQAPTGLYCVSSGKIKLYKTGGDGRSLIVRTAQKGDLVGYRSLLAGENYNATAEMVEEGEVCFIDRATIVSMIAHNPSLAIDIIKKLSHELGESETKLREFSQKSVRERLAELLLVFRDAVGKPSAGGGTLLDQRLTREEMAQMLGSTPETVIRLLHQFQDENWLKLDGKKIILSDISGLTQAAHLED
jgi:CRP-like cAMP-binding protein